MKFEFFMSVTIYIVVFFIATPYSNVGGYQHCAFIFKVDPEDGGSRFFRNVDNHLCDYTGLQPRRSQLISVKFVLKTISHGCYWALVMSRPIRPKGLSSHTKFVFSLQHMAGFLYKPRKLCLNH
jgi:hypothetical protein